ncbi:hypothetical protein [Botrimarina sp.]|uniref:hypothetical protein n=1 Tax=Botrimarina sp. TaxID=2795802 RepID=UPI0032EB4E0C
MHERLRSKLDRIRNDPACGEFVLADAKDSDMAWGVEAFGARASHSGEGRPLTKPEFLADARTVVAQGKIDILLASVSTMSVLAHQERLFESSDVTPAVRANDTTDIWLARGARYHQQPSRPFRTCCLREAQHGRAGPDGEPPGPPRVNLGLYSITFNNDLRRDLEALEAYRDFRAECAETGFRHFLEVFPPNVDAGLADSDLGAYMNDMICRTLAGVALGQRPEFLKIPYLGPAACEELTRFDPSQVVGILGGSSGTTLDAFKLLEDAQRHGARAALFGRKIRNAEDPLLFIEHLRAIVDGRMAAGEALASYHDALAAKGVTPLRPIDEDRRLTDPVLSYK